ncbi:hypothetical protein MMC25_005869 [Agyrium rufum]|nr:hypothetical protein [Agyrium rufum]
MTLEIFTQDLTVGSDAGTTSLLNAPIFMGSYGAAVAADHKSASAETVAITLNATNTTDSDGVRTSDAWPITFIFTHHVAAILTITCSILCQIICLLIVLLRKKQPLFLPSRLRLLHAAWQAKELEQKRRDQGRVRSPTETIHDEPPITAATAAAILVDSTIETAPQVHPDTVRLSQTNLRKLRHAAKIRTIIAAMAAFLTLAFAAVEGMGIWGLSCCSRATAHGHVPAWWKDLIWLVWAVFGIGSALLGFLILGKIAKEYITLTKDELKASENPGEDIFETFRNDERNRDGSFGSQQYPMTMALGSRTMLPDGTTVTTPCDHVPVPVPFSLPIRAPGEPTYRLAPTEGELEMFMMPPEPAYCAEARRPKSPSSSVVSVEAESARTGKTVRSKKEAEKRKKWEERKGSGSGDDSSFEPPRTPNGRMALE